MSLLSFVKTAGEKLFSHGEAQAAQQAAASAPNPDKIAAANAAAGKAIENYIATMQLKADGLKVLVDGASGTVTIQGTAPDQATREKILLCAGNVEGVAHVDDQMGVAAAQAEAKFHTVVSGDTLSKISKDAYGDANKYMAIFEANKPMLSSPDRIYPGQVLRIPPLD